ncbi:aldo/keto reductase [Halomonas sp. MCCC 1A11036]|uniref:Aldo/keto reductase n=1 Tax=Billgrantia zhangzhouensis TaxID=2733481 RepID=A0ABS9AI67_9GAMM|nr:aldo/keto reductase [Halomonas zhangzhouensis]MCE8021476.1 aldo/keto reductase [Halomonas zhangzhouensis]
MKTAYSLTLHDGTRMPALGYGLWQVPKENSAALVSHALQTGYRLIDTAEAYENEEGVGKGIRDSGVAREDIFVTTKVWNTHHGYNQTLRAFDASQQQLGLERIDMYLMHWPSRTRDAYVETWRAMIRLRDEGRVGTIGVCNFSIGQLQRLMRETAVTPVVNQVELHPYFQQKALRAFHREQGIVTQSWSPLGLWWQNPDPAASPLEHPRIRELAKRHGKSPAQIILRWHLDSGLATISKSVRTERIIENFQLFDFALTPSEMNELAGLDRRDGRLGPDPETAEF